MPPFQPLLDCGQLTVPLRPTLLGPPAPSKIWQTSAATISSLIAPSVRFHSVFSRKSAVAALPSPTLCPAAPLPPPLPPAPLEGAVTLESMALSEERLLVCRLQVT